MWLQILFCIIHVEVGTAEIQVQGTYHAAESTEEVLCLTRCSPSTGRSIAKKCNAYFKIDTYILSCVNILSTKQTK